MKTLKTERVYLNTWSLMSKNRSYQESSVWCKEEEEIHYAIFHLKGQKTALLLGLKGLLKNEQEEGYEIEDLMDT